MFTGSILPSLSATLEWLFEQDLRKIAVALTPIPLRKGEGLPDFIHFIVNGCAPLLPGEKGLGDEGMPILRQSC